MKAAMFFSLLFCSILFYTPVLSQNVSINVLTKESGIVRAGNSVFFEVTINNTDPLTIVGMYKLKVQVSLASPAVAIQKAGHSLPTGWEIISNDGNVITLSNGKDLIAPNDARTLLLSLEGLQVGGPVSISGQLSFSNGTPPGTEPGSLAGDKPADNFSTSSCTVVQ